MPLADHPYVSNHSAQYNFPPSTPGRCQGLMTETLRHRSEVTHAMKTHAMKIHVVMTFAAMTESMTTHAIIKML